MIQMFIEAENVPPAQFNEYSLSFSIRILSL